MVKVLILRTAGTNCDHETEFAFTRNGASAQRVHINRLMENPGLLSGFQILAIPGGFSHGDYISAGKIMANQMLHRLSDAIIEFTSSLKLVIGICNGFQVLVKTGLLPGSDCSGSSLDFIQTATLMNNDSGRFICQWTELMVNRDSLFTKGMPERIHLPIAHAEGKFFAGKTVIDKVITGGKAVFRYADNPNGSLEDIAGLTDPTGRILGLMPHPERFCIPEQAPAQHRFPEAFGNAVFKNMIDYFK
jgi:phosphoribosylformylglycinamidine synthase subunit PurQ / glutaminase